MSFNVDAHTHTHTHTHIYTVCIYTHTHAHTHASHRVNIKKKPEAACKNEVTKLSRNGSFLGVCLDLK